MGKNLFALSLMTFYILNIHIPIISCICDLKQKRVEDGTQSVPNLTYIKTNGEDLENSNLESYQYDQYQDFQIGKAINFTPGIVIDIWLLCNHTQPVKWVADANYIKREVEINEYTIRTVGNYKDEKSYRYIAVLRLILLPEDYVNTTTVLMCEEIKRNPCNRRVLLLSSSQDEKDNLVKSLKKEEENNKSVLDFEKKQIEALNPDPKRTIKCPFRLQLLYLSNYREFQFEWINDGGGVGTTSTIYPKSAQAVENAFRLTIPLNEDCVDFSYQESLENATVICPKCKIINYQHDRFKFRPVVFFNRFRGQSRVFKIFFDFNRKDVYFPSERADINVEYLKAISFPKEYYFQRKLTLYKGQEIKLKCHASVSLFSYGLVAMWGLVGETSPQEIVLLSDDNSSTSDFGSLYTNVTTMRPSKDYLDTNNVTNLNITCVLPFWDSLGWTSISTTVSLQNSEMPKIIIPFVEIDEDRIESLNMFNLKLGENITLNCTAKGIPTPILEFITEKQNLNYTERLSIFQEIDIVSLVLTIESIEEAHQGKYKCVAKSLIGETSHVFEIRIPKEFPQFLRILLISLGVVVILFVLISAALVYKYKKEKEDFRRATEETLKRFQDGFKNAKSIDFNPNFEYKEYEIPLGQWGIGGTMLGSGAFGVVQKGFIQRGRSKIVIAVKTVNAPKEVEDFENSLMELVIMSYIGHHEHIVSLVGSCTENIQKRSLMIGVEYCAHGDLLSYIKKRKALFHNFVNKDGYISLDRITNQESYTNIVTSGSFSTPDLYRWAFQISNGMDYLESKKVLHADLAARNILLTEDNIAKISDFGLSRQLIESNSYTKKTNTPLPWRWMAIECLKYQQFSSKSDVWAYGVTLYELFSLGELPWPGLGWTLEFVDELEKGRRLQRPNFATQKMYEAVMCECWENEPEDRITFADAKQFFEDALARLNSTEGKNDNDMTIC